MNNILNYVKKKEKKILFFICFAFALFYITLFVLKYYSLGLKICDQGIFWYIIENFARNGSFYDATVEYTNHLGVHFSPILAFFSLFQLLALNSSFLMLLIYCLLLSFTPLIMHKISKYYFNNEEGCFKRLLCAFSVFAYLPFLYAVTYDFDPLRLAPLFLLAFYYYAVLKKQHMKAIVFAFILCMTRETLSLSLSGVGLYFIIFEKKYKLGILYLIAGFFIFLFTVMILMPYLRVSSSSLLFKGGGIAFSGHYSYLTGSSAKDIILNILSSPLTVLKVFFLEPPLKWVKFIGLAFFLFFIPFFKIRYIILAFFSICVYFLASSASIFFYKSQYLSEIFPAFLFAFPGGLFNFLQKKYKNRLFSFYKKYSLKIMSFSFGFIIILFFSFYYKKIIQLKIKHQDIIIKIDSDPLHLKNKKDIALFVHNRLFYQWGWKKNISLLSKFNLVYPLYKKESKKVYVITYNHKDYGDWNIKDFEKILPTLLKEGFKKVYDYKNFLIYEKVIIP